MNWMDWGIVALFVMLSITIALWHGRRAGKDAEEFFIAGRSLGWFMAGTSMVATTFSSDTPLFVSGAVRGSGIAANWIWWSGALGTLASVFFFARLWRRSGVTTEVELITLRYDKSRVADCLRVFKAISDGVFINCVIMASVTLAVAKISVVIMGLSSAPLFTLPLFGPVPPSAFVVLVLGTIAVGYSTVSGFSGVVWSDALQFLFAMIGAFALAIAAFFDIHSSPELVRAYGAATNDHPLLLQFFPKAGANLEFVTFLILITVGWLPAAPGSGYFLQRVLASKSERDAALGFSWFAFCHFVLRSWPWIFVGVASLVYFPSLQDNESAYPAMVNLLLPTGLKGIMVASLLAAYMSTITSQLNWGSSYVVTDVYRPYIAPDRSGRHYVVAGRAAMVLLALTVALIIPHVASILAAYKYLGVLLTGSSFALIARWYWWRITVVAETVGVVSGLIIGNLLFLILPDRPDADLFAVRMLINLVLSGLVTIIAAYLSSRNGPSPQTVEFYAKVGVQGPGWQRVREEAGLTSRDQSINRAVLAWIGSSLMLFGAMLAPGFALFGFWGPAAGWAAACALGWLIYHKSGFRFTDSNNANGS